jgi:hypothetical protein
MAMNKTPTTKGANAEVTTAEYGIVATSTASRVVNRRLRRRARTPRRTFY